MVFLASAAAASDTPAQALAPGTRRCPMLQAERALLAAARTWRAAAPWRRRGDAAGWGPRGPPGIREQRGAPLEGAQEIIHEEAVAVLRLYARWRPLAPGPRVPAVRQQAHQLQHDLVARREVRPCQEPCAHAPRKGEERATAPQWGLA